MDVGLVSIEFTGNAAPLLATIREAEAAWDVTKRKFEMPVVLGGGVGTGGMGDVNAIKAASQTRINVAKNEVEQLAAVEAAGHTTRTKVAKESAAARASVFGKGSPEAMAARDTEVEIGGMYRRLGTAAEASAVVEGNAIMKKIASAKAYIAQESAMKDAALADYVAVDEAAKASATAQIASAKEAVAGQIAEQKRYQEWLKLNANRASNIAPEVAGTYTMFGGQERNASEVETSSVGQAILNAQSHVWMSRADEQATIDSIAASGSIGRGMEPFAESEVEKPSFLARIEAAIGGGGGAGSDVEKAGRRYGGYWKYRGGEMALRGMSGINPEAIVESGLTSAGGISSNLGMLGMLSGNPWVVGGGIVAGAGLGLAGMTAHYGEQYEAGMRLSGSQIGLSPNEFERLYGIRAQRRAFGQPLSEKYGIQGLKQEDINNQISRLIESFGGTSRAKESSTFLPMINIAMQMAKGTGDTLQEVVSEMRSVMSEIGLKFEGPNAISGAALVKKFDEVANVINAAGREGQMRGPQLAHALPRFAAVAADLHMGMAQIASTAEVISRAFNTNQSSFVGRAARGILTYIEKLGGSPKMLEKYGLTSEEVSIPKIGFADVIKNITNAIKKLPTETERNNASLDIFKIRWANTFDVLKKNMDEWYLMAKKIEGTKSVSEMAAAQMNTLQTKEAQVAAEFRNLFIGVFQDDKGDFKAFVGDIGDLLKSVERHGPELAIAVKGIIEVLRAITTFAAMVPDLAAIISNPMNPKNVINLMSDVGVARSSLNEISNENGKIQYHRLPPVPGGSHMELLKRRGHLFPGTAAEFQGNGGLDLRQARNDFYSRKGPNSNDYGTDADYQLALKYWKNKAQYSGGGHTGSGLDTDIAGYVHANEYVLDAPTVRRMGLARVKALHKRLRGYDGGGLVLPMPGGDSSDWMKEAMSIGLAPYSPGDGSGGLPTIDMPGLYSGNSGSGGLPTIDMPGLYSGNSGSGGLPTIDMPGLYSGNSGSGIPTGISSLLSAIGGTLPGKTDFMGAQVGTANMGNAVSELLKGFDPANSTFSNIISGRAGSGIFGAGGVSGASVLSGIAGGVGGLVGALDHKAPPDEYNWNGSIKRKQPYSELGAIAGAALPMISNILLPGSGALLSPVLNSLGVNATGQTGSLFDPSNALSLMTSAMGFMGLKSGGYAGADSGYVEPGNPFATDMSGVHDRLDKLTEIMSKPQRNYVATGDMWAASIVGEQEASQIAL